ncbi:MAG TPA: HD domain-containing phosphohydrolase [Rectinemataceae bacterium]
MTRILQVLCVEDSEDDAFMIQRALESGGLGIRFERVQTEAAMRKALEDQTWDLVISDYRLPQFSGSAALALLKEFDLDLPFILVSGAIGEETATSMMKSGASDYIMKSRLQRLAPAVERELADAEIRKERRKALKELEASRAQLFNAMEMARLGHWYYDIGADLFTFNDQFYKLFRTTAEEVGGYTMKSSEYSRRFVHPDDAGTVADEIRMVLETEDPDFHRHIEHRIRYADGSIGYIGVRFFLVKDDKGRTIGTTGVNQDITESKMAEMALRESERKYRSLFDNAQEGIFQVTLDGRFITANAAMSSMLGYDSPEDLISSVAEISRDVYSDPEDRAKLMNMIAHASAVKGFVCQFRKKDTSLIWVSIDEHAVRDADGATLRYEGFCEDISERVSNTERLRKALGATISAISAAVEARDPYTAGHQSRVSELVQAIGSELDISPDRLEGLRLAASIHDLGKLSVPAEILTKPKKLLPMEFDLIKVHSQAGFDILKDIEFPWPIARIVLEHHERMDGSGYPQGLKGEASLLESRILAVADVVESMASYRPYRPALGIEAALEEIENGKGICYDGSVVEACLRLFREKEFVLK